MSRLESTKKASSASEALPVSVTIRRAVCWSLCRSPSRTCSPGRRSASHPTSAGANIAIITPSMAADSVGETTMQAVPTTTRPRPIAR